MQHHAYILTPEEIKDLCARAADEAVAKMQLVQSGTLAQWYTAEQAMRLLNVGRTKLWHLVLDGAIEHNGVAGKARRYSRESLEQYLTRQRNAAR